jgi:hypothetical protein
VGSFSGVILLISQAVLGADPPSSITYPDPDYDVVARPTDLGATAPFDPAIHRLIDLREISLVRWEPVAPELDVFDGAAASGGGFVRLDVVVGGLVNPPGSTDPATFDPFEYGDHPVYGFVEIDLDDDNETGGEVDSPQFRYLGNIARFGGLPEGIVFDDRLATDAAAFDWDFLSKPYVERHGEEFHLALLGDRFSSSGVAEVLGDGDLVFEGDEVWVLTGDWFHRAHGFEPYSLATGGYVPGEYSPECQLRFEHDSAAETTLISLVFPLNNAAAAAMRGENPEPPNHDPSDQASVSEALADLRDSAAIVYQFPTGDPEEALILGWKDKSPGQFIQPTDWRVTALLGTSYTSAGHGFVWTDAYPNVIRGDVDGENGADNDDANGIYSFISEHDGDDGLPDGQVALLDFAEDFSVFDVNHDGVVGSVDVMLVSPVGDGDLDGDVDLADYAVWQVCHGVSGAPLLPPCALQDLDSDGDVDLTDFVWLSNLLTGPVGP